ncbi:MAG: hypothetical protein ABJP48_13445 [Erythrobacter sp.]
MKIASVAALALGAFAASTAIAQTSETSQPDTSADAAETSSGEIVVEGYREQQVRDFLWRSLVETGGNLAKRTDPVCLGIDNLPDTVTSELRGRIQANLDDFQIPLAEPGCDINAVVVFHDNPQAFMNWLASNRPVVFDALYRPERNRLIREKRQVYSWMFIPTAIPDRNRADQNLIGTTLVPTASAAEISRIPQGEPDSISHSFTVVGTEMIDGMSIAQLGDYLTMQILIEFKPGKLEHAPRDSIMNLFFAGNPEDSAPQEMSSLDRALVRGLYQPQRQRFNAGSIRGDVARRSIRTLDDEGLLDQVDD